MCGGIVSSNRRISHFLSQILKPIIKEAESTCDSTEDLLHRVRHCNDSETLENCIIGSMDVEALYPSIDIDFSLSCCSKLLMESDITFESVDYSELGLFLSMTNSRDELLQNNLSDFCPRRENVSGRKPKLEASGIDNDAEVRWRNWIPPERVPLDDHTKKRMVVFALVTSMNVVMKNHIYQFNHKYLKQQEGGAIGVGLAGEIANGFMVWWDREFKSRVQQKGVSLKLYSRYVDDIDLVSTKVSNADLSSSQAEKETMEFLQKVANEIHPSIRVTIDFPSNHECGRLPVLDVQQWIGDVLVDGVQKKQILHSHYMKEMSSKSLISKDSALAVRAKMNILSADLLRVMRNVSPLCPEEERTGHVQEFIHRMQYSGYSVQERIDVYRNARRRYETILENDKNGIIPMYRGKFWHLQERTKEKREKADNWYRKGGFDTVMFVDATPGEKLANECRTIIGKAGLKIRVVEKAGTSVKRSVVKSNPFGKQMCECEICKRDSTSKLNCKQRGVVYEIKCQGSSGNECCKSTYIGETSRRI